jgi:chromosomal replication initiator protein
MREGDLSLERTNTSRFPDYTFSQFVVGEANRVAFDSACVVATNPGRAANPLVLHGGVGLGKTHLAVAIAHELAASPRSCDVLATSADELARWCESAGTSDGHLGAALAGHDVLIVDDVQLVAPGGPAERALFRTLDRWLEVGRQLVLTCDKLPSQVPALSARLSGLFDRGLAAEILSPERSLRRAIVTHKAKLWGIAISPEVSDFISGVEMASVRALEGALNRVAVLASLSGRELSLMVARQALAAALLDKVAQPSVDAIAQAVACVFGTSVRSLRSRRRDRETVAARQMVVYVARRVGRTLTEISADLGCRDHSVAAHGYATFASRVARDGELLEKLARVERRLGLAHEHRRIAVDRPASDLASARVKPG